MTEKYITCTIGGKDYNAHFKSFGESYSNFEWSFWDRVTLPFYKGRRVLKDLFYECKYAFQRLVDGYDCRDVFNVDVGFITRYKKILENFKKYNNGYPSNMTYEEWIDIIDRMLYHLQFMDSCFVEDELYKFVGDGFFLVDDTVHKIVEEHKNKFFELFSKYFYSLWY